MRIISSRTLPEEDHENSDKIKRKLIIPKGQLPLVQSMIHVTLQPGDVESKHEHADRYEVLYVEKGSGMIMIQDTNIVLEEGMCVTVEPGELHELKNNTNKELALLVISIIK